MSKIHVGDCCIIDPEGLLGLKEYKVKKVRVLKKNILGMYVCAPLEPIVFPVTNDNHVLRYIKVHKRFLTKCEENEKIVVRTPLNMPAFTWRDSEAITRAINVIKLSNPENDKLIKDLKKIAIKIAYVEEFNNVES